MVNLGESASPISREVVKERYSNSHHQDVPKYLANLVGIPNGIPTEKANRNSNLKSATYLIRSDYPGSTKQAVQIRHLAIIASAFFVPEWMVLAQLCQLNDSINWVVGQNAQPFIPFLGTRDYTLRKVG